MIARMRFGMGGITAVAIIVAALWIWTRSAEISLVLVTHPSHPRLELWSIRCGALAAAAGAQWLLVGGVFCAFYEEKAADAMVRSIFGLVSSLAMIVALGLAIAGR